MKSQSHHISNYTKVEWKESDYVITIEGDSLFYSGGKERLESSLFVILYEEWRMNVLWKGKS